MSAEEAVAYAMDWEPKIVAMCIIKKGTAQGSKRSKGYHIYNLEAPKTTKTQIVTALSESYEKDGIFAVALKGMRLTDRSIIEKEFKFGGPTSSRPKNGPTWLVNSCAIVSHRM
jgi:hypothetical protein